jgi:hypothetical protein
VTHFHSLLPHKVRLDKPGHDTCNIKSDVVSTQQNIDKLKHFHSNYSRPPNTEPRSVFGFDLMPVPDIRVQFASLDRLGMNKIFVINKTV